MESNVLEAGYHLPMPKVNLSAAQQHQLETLSKATGVVTEASRALRQAKRTVKVLALAAIDAGVPLLYIARAVGVSRTTVRAWRNADK